MGGPCRHDIHSSLDIGFHPRLVLQLQTHQCLLEVFRSNLYQGIYLRQNGRDQSSGGHHGHHKRCVFHRASHLNGKGARPIRSAEACA